MSDTDGVSKWLPWGSVALLASYFAWNSLYYFPFMVDDTFISLRYAQNLVDGHGLVYNTGQRIEGFSNFSWVMLEALLLALGLPAITGIKLIGLAAGLGAVVSTYFLAGRLFAGQQLHELKRLLAVGLLCLNTSLAIWTQAGLETVLLSFLLVATCWRYEVELNRENAFPWSALLFSLAWLTRPEVPVYVLYLLARRWVARTRRPWCRADRNWLIAAAAVIVPYEIWGLWYYGRILPATYNAKIGGPESAGLAGSIKRLAQQPILERFLFSQGWGFPAILLVAAAGSIAGRKYLRPALWLVPACGLIFVLYAHEDWMPRHRFFVPVLPFICLFVAFGLSELLRLARRGRVWIVLWCVVCTVCVSDYARFQAFGGGKRENGPVTFGSHVKKTRPVAWPLDVPHQLTRRVYPVRGRAQYLLENVPSGEWVCIRDIGFPGYLTMNPIWDLPGLLTPTAARAKRDGSAESNQALYRELLGIRPAWFRLVVRSDQQTLSNTIDSWLRTDPVAKPMYRETSRIRRGRSQYVTYLRKDLPAVDLPARKRDARSRIPDWTEIGTAAATPADP